MAGRFVRRNSPKSEVRGPGLNSPLLVRYTCGILDLTKDRGVPFGITEAQPGSKPCRYCQTMNLSNPTGSPRWFAHELVFAWLTLTAGALLFALLATLLAVMGFSETVSFLVSLLVTLVLVVALHLNRLAEQWPNTGRGSALRKRILNLFIKAAEPRSEEEIVLGRLIYTQFVEKQDGVLGQVRRPVFGGRAEG